MVIKHGKAFENEHEHVYILVNEWVMILFL